jgi:energy-coupling factor transporter transmembrane protein EcfT
MRLLNILLVLLFFGVLTVITQVGGLVFLISLFIAVVIDRRITTRWARITANVFSFTILYLFFTFVIVPMAAKPLGRVPLPIFERRNLKPANLWTCLLNRNYVRPELSDVAYSVADRLTEKYPGTTINYLDANFPFIDNFPLFPHLSHSDGKKLDLSFQYNDGYTGLITTDVPSFIGYGICEEPSVGEENKPEYCDKKGYWQYSLLRNMVSRKDKNKFVFDNERTRELVNGFASHEILGKIFIEPHLKTRLRLTSAKIRFHGCQAVRHDDHIHVQLK